jgi:hypothetical protein
MRLVHSAAATTLELGDHDASRFERDLVRRSVGALRADREACAHCGRSPLIGEHVHVYGSGALVCDLCRPRRREEPLAVELVRHSEFGQAVRIKRAA